MSRINLTDNSDLIVKKIQKAKTDSDPIGMSIITNTSRPEAKNLINIFSALKNKKPSQTLEEWEGKQFSEFKKALAEILVEKICPIGKEIIKLKSDINFLENILHEGRQKAEIIADKNLKEIKTIVGI